MKLYILLIISFFCSCIAHKIILHTKKLDKIIAFNISIDSNQNLYVHVKPKFDTGSIVISKPSVHPITYLELYDKSNNQIFLPKVKSSVDLKREIIKLNVGEVFLSQYDNLKRLVPDSYKQIKMIRATYFYNAYQNNLNSLSDSLILE